MNTADVRHHMANSSAIGINSIYCVPSLAIAVNSDEILCVTGSEITVKHSCCQTSQPVPQQLLCTVEAVKHCGFLVGVICVYLLLFTVLKCFVLLLGMQNKQ